MRYAVDRFEVPDLPDRLTKILNCGNGVGDADVDRAGKKPLWDELHLMDSKARALFSVYVKFIVP